jgi:SAM-dependent methyltransferase
MPIFPKAEGYNVKVVDHATAPELRAKYGSMGVDVSRIEDVDYVWSEGPISALTGTGQFRYVFSSHVIEHMTDFAGFLSDSLKLLSNGGELVLLVPNKQTCFDLLQPLTDTAKVLADHIQGRRRHSFEAFFREDYHVAAAHPDTEYLIAWWPRQLREISLRNCDPLRRLESAQRAAGAQDYLDAHEYYFTPSSFVSIVNDLCYLGLIGGRIQMITRVRGCEFLAILTPSGPSIDLNTLISERRRLGLQTIRELAEAAEWLPSG